MQPRLRLLVLLASAASVLLPAAGASAQHPHVTPLHRDPFEMPEMFAHTKLGLDLMYGRLDVPPDEEASLLAFELVGAVRISRGGYVHVRLPLGYAHLGDNGDTALGNVSLGLEHQISTSASHDQITVWSLGGSVSLPTATTGDALGTASLHTGFRMPYPGRYAPDTTTVRLHTQFRLDTRLIFLQAQAGINALLVDGPGDETLLRLGLAFGVNLARSTALIGELTTLSDVLDDTRASDFWHSINVGFRFRAGAHSRLGLRVYLPLDDVYRDLNVWGLGFTFTQFL